MSELKRRPTPMPGTIKTLEYYHDDATCRNSCVVPPLSRTNMRPNGTRRRRSSEIMNYIDHIIDKGVPTPQLSVYREITKPYTRLSDSSGSTTEAPTRTEQMLEDSNSSLSFVSCIHDTFTDESPSFSRKVSKQKEDRPPTIAMWGWDSGLLDSAEDDEKDIWDEIFHSNRR